MVLISNNCYLLLHYDDHRNEAELFLADKSRPFYNRTSLKQLYVLLALQYNDPQYATAKHEEILLSIMNYQIYFSF